MVFFRRIDDPLSARKYLQTFPSDIAARGLLTATRTLSAGIRESLWYSNKVGAAIQRYLLKERFRDSPQDVRKRGLIKAAWTLVQATWRYFRYSSVTLNMESYYYAVLNWLLGRQPLVDRDTEAYFDRLSREDCLSIEEIDLELAKRRSKLTNNQ